MNGVYINILNNWSIQYASIEFTQPLLDKHVYYFGFWNTWHFIFQLKNIFSKWQKRNKTLTPALHNNTHPPLSWNLRGCLPGSMRKLTQPPLRVATRTRRGLCNPLGNKMIRKLFGKAGAWKSEMEEGRTWGRASLLRASWYCHKHAVNAHMLCYSKHSPSINYLFHTAMLPIFKIKTLRHRKVKRSVTGHSAGKWQCRNVKLVMCLRSPCLQRWHYTASWAPQL